MIAARYVRILIATLGLLALATAASAQASYWTKWSWTRKLDTQGQVIYPDGDWKAGDYYDTGQECRRSIVARFQNRLDDGTILTAIGERYIIQSPDKSAIIVTFKCLPAGVQP
ncbi:MAG: hypothetical protein ACHQ8D_11140 [Candidatus Rokuibacteriota bacterium]